MDTIEHRVAAFIQREFIADRGGSDLPLGPTDPLVESGIVDSLGIFQLIAFVEEEFGADVLPEDVVSDNFATVHAIANLVRLRLAVRQKPAA